MARRTRWLCSSVKAEYDLVHGEKGYKGKTGKLEEKRGQASTRGQPGLWDRNYGSLLVQAETRKKDRKPPGITLPSGPIASGR